MKRILFLLLVGLGFVGCEFAIEDKVVGKYYMVANNVGEECNLSFKQSNSDYNTIISACVYSVGFNDNYIIAKQHPLDFPNELDKTVIQYYILPMKNGKNRNSKHDLIGPLNLSEFNQKSKELGIENLEFSIVYDYME